MRLKELKSLLARAAAALETPDDLTAEDKTYLIEDLRVAESEADSFLEESESDILTAAQRERWARLQIDQPGYEIERNPHAIGYWSRQAGYAAPTVPGEEMVGWLAADDELKEGVMEGTIWLVDSPVDSTGQPRSVWCPHRELTPMETNVLEVAIDHMVEHLEDLNQFESDSDELRARLDAAKTLKRDLWTDVVGSEQPTSTPQEGKL